MKKMFPLRPSQPSPSSTVAASALVSLAVVAEMLAVTVAELGKTRLAVAHSGTSLAAVAFAAGPASLTVDTAIVAEVVAVAAETIVAKTPFAGLVEPETVAA